MPPRKISDLIVNAILADYRGGMLIRQIMSKHDVSMTFISKAAIAAGLRRQFHTLPDDMIKSIVSDYRVGVLIKVIAPKYGISGRTVSKIAHGHGLRRQLYRKRSSDNGGTIRQIGI